VKASEGRVGRVFVIRLEDGDAIPGCIEHFAEQKQITTGQVLMVGGIGDGQVVVGPRRSQEMPPDPIMLPIDGAHEVIGVGLIAPNEQGKSVLHIHGSLGRAGQTTTGCLRPGVTTWVVGEVIIYELLGIEAVRALDKKTGFELLEITQGGII
jgi:uncharacterized protein